MTYTINETHDPALQSWVESANDPHSDFPIQNLPFGVFRRRGSVEQPRVGVAIGDQIVDVGACVQHDLIDQAALPAARACQASTLNGLMAFGRPHWSALRRALSTLLRGDQYDGRTATQLLVPMSEAELLLPAAIGDYTDFYASIFHATNVGSMFRPDNPLLPNYKHVPIGYHGRASSVVVSGTPITRPSGQTRAPNADQPSFGPSKLLDYELEVGWFVGPGNRLGEPITIDQAADQIFGLCLVNDWSARDVQTWEYQPLGPFLAKSFATTISPWVVTTEALAPFRGAAFRRSDGDPTPLPYLMSAADQVAGGIDLQLAVELSSDQMRQEGLAPLQLSASRFTDMYWTIAQMLTHHASNGCNLRPGDLLASGTVSGSDEAARGCLLERTWRGAEPIALPTGETRTFLQDGDEVVLRGWCERQGAARIGFGACRGVVLPAVR